MKHVNVKGMDMSVFTLGTVQLGMDYGLGEHTQKPPKEAAFALLDRAAACGVNALDTANNYAQLVLAHCARGFAAWTSVKAIRELVDNGNVWFDLSSICEPSPMMACIIKNAGERTMWGSDYPICMTRGRAVSLATGQNWLTDLHAQKTRVIAENLLAFYQSALLLNLDQTQLDNLFCNNARRLFNA